MNNNIIWCESLKKYWQEKNINKILELFDESVTYYEEPNNTITYNELINVWSEIKEQDTTNIEFNILVEEENKCIANFILKTKSTIDMIYEIRLNNENKCIYFKQWYMEY